MNAYSGEFEDNTSANKKIEKIIKRPVTIFSGGK